MKHFVTGKNLFDEYPDGSCQIIFGAGCFWGVERVFWQLDGVWTTYVSYSGGRRENPSYEQVCTGVTGHAETVNVIYKPDEISLESLLKVFGNVMIQLKVTAKAMILARSTDQQSIVSHINNWKQHPNHWNYLMKF